MTGATRAVRLRDQAGPEQREDRWAACEWFLVTCPDCLSLGAHEMGEA